MQRLIQLVRQLQPVTAATAAAGAHSLLPRLTRTTTHHHHQQIHPTHRTRMSTLATTPSSTSTCASSRRFRVGCIQMTSGEDMASNIAVCTAEIRAAAAAGCRFILTPENTGRMTAVTQKAASSSTSSAQSDSTAAATSSTPSTQPQPTPPADKHPVLLAMSELATELQIWILIGSIAVRVEGEEKRFANRSYLIGPTSSSDSSQSSSSPASILASYDKIFMFDVPSLNGAESYLESARVVPGSSATLVKGLDGLASGASLGMTICYDLRFPQLYRLLAQAGANMIAVPSAFTVVTGEAHWHALLRARAIETGCYIFAPAQSGTHPGDRKTYGHSLIIDPWGTILVDADVQSPTFIMAEIDLDQCDLVRKRIPSLQHDRPFTLQTYSP